MKKIILILGFFTTLLFSSSYEDGLKAYKNSDFKTALLIFKTLKKELVRKTIFHTRAEARDKIFEYIEMFYNSKRRHSFLDFISPNEFEKRYNDSVTQPKVLTE
ncbi:MAG: IS3 family transposase [Arcobacter sp.]|nr:IS3 family transposase [Arcobacter sp.]